MVGDLNGDGLVDVVVGNVGDCSGGRGDYLQLLLNSLTLSGKFAYS